MGGVLRGAENNDTYTQIPSNALHAPQLTHRSGHNKWTWTLTGASYMLVTSRRTKQKKNRMLPNICVSKDTCIQRWSDLHIIVYRTLLFHYVRVEGGGWIDTVFYVHWYENKHTKTEACVSPHIATIDNDWLSANKRSKDFEIWFQRYARASCLARKRKR